MVRPECVLEQNGPQRHRENQESGREIQPPFSFDALGTLGLRCRSLRGFGSGGEHSGRFLGTKPGRREPQGDNRPGSREQRTGFGRDVARTASAGSARRENAPSGARAPSRYLSLPSETGFAPAPAERRTPRGLRLRPRLPRGFPRRQYPGGWRRPPPADGAPTPSRAVATCPGGWRRPPPADGAPTPSRAVVGCAPDDDGRPRRVPASSRPDGTSAGVLVGCRVRGWRRRGRRDGARRISTCPRFGSALFPLSRGRVPAVSGRPEVTAKCHRPPIRARGSRNSGTERENDLPI